MFNKLNKKLVIILIFGITVLLAGCDINLLFVENNGLDHAQASYKLFNDTKTRSVKLEKGETLTVDYKAEIKKGDLTVTFNDPDGNVLYTLKPNTKTKFEIDEKGRYKFIIKGEETSGKYNIKWSKE